MLRSTLLAACLTLLPFTASADDAQVAATMFRPNVPGTLRVSLQSRDKETGEPTIEEVEWNAAETAVIICDMWDGHYCQLSAQRVGVMAPKMNRVVSAARSLGVQIIHAPSGVMDQYADTPFRLRMQQAPAAETPVPIGPWCDLDPEIEAALPIDTTQSYCDDPVVGEAVKRFEKQHPALDIIGFDGISDNGQEIYNLCQHLGIKNIVLMGVHTNLCVLGRPFGLRQQVKLGMNVALCRDLTDAMYDPRQPPYVSHTRGTELVIEHIEKYVCPSIAGADLMEVVAGSDVP